MNIDKKIKSASMAYLNYSNKCADLAIEAQKYIDFDDNVGCEYIPGTGLCILASVPNGYSIPESVCAVDSFFSLVDKNEGMISAEEFKSICI